MNAKYARTIWGQATSIERCVVVDVYAVLEAFEVIHPAIQHAAKKVLCAGWRGHKGLEEDLRGAIDSLERAIQMIKEKVA